MINFECGHCGRAVKAQDAYAGKRGKCPFCKEVMSIPALRGAIADLAAAMESEAARRGSDSTIGPVPPPPAVEEPRLDEEIALPGDHDTLQDTVILPAEADAEADAVSVDRHHHAAARRSPALSAGRTILLVAAIVIVLAAAIVGFLAIYIF